MTRPILLALLCLACGANYESSDDDAETGGSAGMVASGGSAGAPEAGQAGAAGMVQTGGTGPTGGLGGTVATGGASTTGGVSTGGVSPTGGASTGGVPTGGTASGGTAPTGGSNATGGALPTGGAAGASPSGGSGGSPGTRLIWSREFTINATPATTAGTFARHEIKILRRTGPDDLCVTLGGAVPHGETGTATFGYGDLLRNCLSAVPQTSPSRHEFEVMATTSTSQAGGGEYFELPEESRMWLARTVVRRITQNAWADGAVTVRETWEFWE